MEPSPHLTGPADVNEARVRMHYFPGLRLPPPSSFPLPSLQAPGSRLHSPYTCTAVSLRFPMAAITRFIGTRSALPRFSPVSPALLSRGIAYKLFVGGLSFLTTEKGLSEAFSEYGQVVEAKIVMDKVSDRSKGFGFVTFASEDEAENAITGMNGKALNGRVVFVDYAKPKSNIGDGMPIARGPPEPTAHS